MEGVERGRVRGGFVLINVCRRREEVVAVVDTGARGDPFCTSTHEALRGELAKLRRAVARGEESVEWTLRGGSMRGKEGGRSEGRVDRTRGFGDGAYERGRLERDWCEEQERRGGSGRRAYEVGVVLGANGRLERSARE